MLFCSGNPFQRLPPVLGDCASLSQVGFRGCGLREVPAEALPPHLRWLTLTDNAIAELPEALGACASLQKLMLAGNGLRRLPESLAGAARLELVRLSANLFETLPPWLPELPRLAWLAWGGNPGAEPVVASPSGPAVSWSALAPGALLGEGASGQVYAADWIAPGAAARPVAVKLFKGALTSDGRPDCEMAACLAAGAHPNLVGALARVTGHPTGAQGLVMPLLPRHWRVLAAPPSLETCSRDVYDPALRLPLAAALRIAVGIGAAAVHLHAGGLLHGDLYAHNILWDGSDGAAVLSDFGAASAIGGSEAVRLQRLDALAWGILLREVLARCAEPIPSDLDRLQEACVQADPNRRPRLAEALDVLQAYRS